MKVVVKKLKSDRTLSNFVKSAMSTTGYAYALLIMGLWAMSTTGYAYALLIMGL
jgi:hypothetical protein